MKSKVLLFLLSLNIAGAQSTHMVQAGDTLSSLSRKYQTTPTTLAELNALSGSNLRIGQVLRLPTPPQHVVQAGETLYGIARKEGVTPEVLIELNGLESSTLRVGQVLQLTSGSSLPTRNVASASRAPAVQQPPAAPSLPAALSKPALSRSTGQLQRGLFTPTRLPTLAALTLRTAGTSVTRPPAAYLPRVGFGMQTRNNCGPAAVAAVLNAYGVQADQKTWQDRLRPDGGNMQSASAAALFSELGFSAPVLRGGTIDDVKRHVAEGVPVIVLQYHSVIGKVPHFRVVRGYDETQGILIMSDSLSGPNVALTEHDFDLLWNTQGRQYLPVRPSQG